MTDRTRVFGAIAVGIAAYTSPAVAQGRCIRSYGTPPCNTDPIAPVFARTGWRTTRLDHITFRVAEPRTEAAFYAACARAEHLRSLGTSFRHGHPG